MRSGKTEFNAEESIQESIALNAEGHNSRSNEASDEDLNAELYNIRVAQCDGEAHAQVQTAQDGEGIFADSLIHKLFIGIGGQGASSIAQPRMNPVAPKQDWRLAEAVGNLMENMRHFELMGEQHNMAVPYSLEAVRDLMITQRAKLWFEQAEPKVN